VERIDEDLDLQAKKKKLLRLADAEFLAGQTLDLPKLQQLQKMFSPSAESYQISLFGPWLHQKEYMTS
jgi:hypothetical protein